MKDNSDIYKLASHEIHRCRKQTGLNISEILAIHAARERMVFLRTYERPSEDNDCALPGGKREVEARVALTTYRALVKS